MKVKFDAQAWVNARLKEATDSVIIKLRFGYVQVLAREIEAVANREIAKLFPFITNKLIGLRDRAGDSTQVDINALYGGVQTPRSAQFLRAGGKFNPLGSQYRKNQNSFKAIKWRTLSIGTLQRKRRGPNPENYNRFFRDTGKLQALFGRTNSVTKLGGLKATVTRRISSELVGSPVKVTVPFALMKINFFQKLTSSLQAISEGKYDSNVNVERHLFGPTIAKKLAGFKYKPEYHRPLVQPVIGYFANVAIPNAILRALAKKIRNT